MKLAENIILDIVKRKNKYLYVNRKILLIQTKFNCYDGGLNPQ
jgi:hypothetical protein